jgi:hypothetical protein
LYVVNYHFRLKMLCGKFEVLVAETIKCNVFGDVTASTLVGKHVFTGAKGVTSQRLVIVRFCTGFSCLPKVLHIHPVPIFLI